jgi:hypothetical protein
MRGLQERVMPEHVRAHRGARRLLDDPAWMRREVLEKAAEL